MPLEYNGGQKLGDREQFTVDIRNPVSPDEGGGEDSSAFFGNVQSTWSGNIFGTDDLIPIHGFSWGGTVAVSTSAGSGMVVRGKATPLDVSITRYVGKGSTDLFSYFMNGGHLGDFNPDQDR